MKKIYTEKIPNEEALQQLQQLLNNEGGCADIIKCGYCPLFYYRRERGLSTMNCTSTGNLETAHTMIKELEATELMKML